MISYTQWVELALTDLQQVDFDALRATYPEAEGYDPYAMLPAPPELLTALQTQDWGTALTYLLMLLKTDFLQAKLHLTLAHVLNELGDGKQAEWHLAVAQGLTQSLMASGTGVNFAEAFQVVHLREEYDVFSILEVHPLSQTVGIYQDQHFDVIQVQPNDGSEPFLLYFNIEWLHQALNREALAS